MKERRLADGSVAYYWVPRCQDRVEGFSITSEALGKRYATAVERAEFLNACLRDWRTGKRSGREAVSPKYGTIDWLFTTYCQTERFSELAARTKPSYRKAMERLSDVVTKEGKRAGTYLLVNVTALAVDKLYAKLRVGQNGQAVHKQANFAIWLAGRAWRMIQRREPMAFPAINPFEGVERVWKRTAKKAATRDEAYALSNVLNEMGHPHLGLVPLVCYEWHQRPENVLAGHLRWADWRAPSHPNAVRVEHHKTREEVWLPLQDGGVKLYPEIEEYLRDSRGSGHRLCSLPASEGHAAPIRRHMPNTWCKPLENGPGCRVTSPWMPAGTAA